MNPLHPLRHAWLPLLALALSACGGGGGTESDPIAGTSRALAVSQPGELTRYVQDRLRTLDSQGRLSINGLNSGGPSSVAAFPSGAAAAAAAPRSGTVLQENGVDEADLMLSDGEHIFTLQPNTEAGPTLAVLARSAGGPTAALASLDLPADGAVEVTPEGMVMSDDQRTLAVLTHHWLPQPAGEICEVVCTAFAPVWFSSRFEVQRVDVSNAAQATAGERISIDGTLLDSRRIGHRLYVVSVHRPVLPPLYLPTSASAAEREAAIANLRAGDLLPRMRRNGGAAQALLSETDCYVQAGNRSTDVVFTTLTVFDLSSPTLASTSRCFMGGTDALYLSPTSLYLATNRWVDTGGAATLVLPQAMQTDIHKFALNGDTVDYRGSGEALGHLGWDRERKSFRLSEHNGDLRVLTFTGSVGWASAGDDGAVAPSPARLTILRENAAAGALQAVSTLPNDAHPEPLGKAGEQIYAVRFVGDRGYVVTFRRTDPLYVLDLSNPADPRAVGELELAGFSESLYPLDNNLVLGVGRDADSSGRVTGLKLALFDMSNPAVPSVVDSLTLGLAGSTSTLDYSRHGLNMLVQGTRVRLALPVTLALGANYSNWHHGLQKFEIDTAARTLRNVGRMADASIDGYAPLWQERSLQIGDWVYFLSSGGVQAEVW
jgi:hypothetical protein